ncbi:MAG: hypothetical protein NVSMB18_12670 [Acetobacteraceae bacterium]
MTRAVAAALLLCLAAPAMAQTVRDSIEQANAAWIAAFNRGDTAAVAALYAEDATVLPPGGPITTGRPAIQQLWQATLGQLQKPELKTLAVTSSGDLAREIGQLAGLVGGKPFAGKYVVVWKKVGSAWLIDSDIWNANQ